MAICSSSFLQFIKLIWLARKYNFLAIALVRQCTLNLFEKNPQCKIIVILALPYISQNGVCLSIHTLSLTSCIMLQFLLPVPLAHGLIGTQFILKHASAAQPCLRHWGAKGRWSPHVLRHFSQNDLGSLCNLLWFQSSVKWQVWILVFFLDLKCHMIIHNLMPCYGSLVIL